MRFLIAGFLACFLFSPLNSVVAQDADATAGDGYEDVEYDPGKTSSNNLVACKKNARDRFDTNCKLGQERHCYKKGGVCGRQSEVKRPVDINPPEPDDGASEEEKQEWQRARKTCTATGTCKVKCCGKDAGTFSVGDATERYGHVSLNQIVLDAAEQGISSEEMIGTIADILLQMSEELNQAETLNSDTRESRETEASLDE